MYCKIKVLSLIVIWIFHFEQTDRNYNEENLILTALLIFAALLQIIFPYSWQKVMLKKSGISLIKMISQMSWIWRR